MKILFYGDSITDAGRNYDVQLPNQQLGRGYVSYAATRLFDEDLAAYDIYNRGVSGNRIVDLYARIKANCWNLEPDVLSILIGVNDVWHEVASQNGVELDRFENIYRLMLRETKERLPKTKIMLCEPFVLLGSATEAAYDRFLEVKKYAEVVKKLADEFSATFVPLQAAFDDAGAKYGNAEILSDGVHPTLKGAVVLGNEWLRAFKGMNE